MKKPYRYRTFSYPKAGIFLLTAPIIIPAMVLFGLGMLTAYFMEPIIQWGIELPWNIDNSLKRIQR